MKRILLINLPVQDIVANSLSDKNYYDYNPSLGLLSLGTWLEVNGYECQIVDLSYERLTPPDILDIIDEEEFIFIGMSVYTENFELAKMLSKKIKSKYYDLPIVLGGAHPSLMPKESIECKYVDFVIKGEGESTIVELATAIESNEEIIRYNQIKGLILKDIKEDENKEIKGYISDLDLLPIIKRELVDIDRYNNHIYMYTSRGCPGNCIYCAATVLSGGCYRVRSAESVFMEIVSFKSLYKNKDFKFIIIDDTFTVFKERVKQFCRLIIENNEKFNWGCESRIDSMSEELLSIMKNANCKSIQYGIESGSQKVLDGIRKNISLVKAREIIESTYKNNINPALSFMLGHYCDTKESMMETYEFIKEMYSKYRANISVSYNTPFPGTWQYNNIESLGMELKRKEYKLLTLTMPVVETKFFTIDDQIEVMKMCDKYKYNMSKINGGYKSYYEKIDSKNKTKTKL